MPKTEKQMIGRLGEDQAARYLKKNKFKIIERNLHVSHNEIDIIAISKKQRINHEL